MTAELKGSSRTAASDDLVFDKGKGSTQESAGLYGKTMSPGTGRRHRILRGMQGKHPDSGAFRYILGGLHIEIRCRIPDSADKQPSSTSPVLSSTQSRSRFLYAFRLS